MDFKGMTMNQSKGFTIIELLVVIAIIAVLAAIVLVNVAQYITKGKDAAIKANMSTILTNSAVWYDGTGVGSYVGFTDDNGYKIPRDEIIDIDKTVTPGTITDGTKFCACATLYEIGMTYCIDSSGYKKSTDTVCGTRCPDAGATGAGVCGG